MHHLVQLAQEQKNRAIERYKKLIATLESQDGLSCLDVTPLVFEKDIGGTNDELLNFEVAAAAADRLITTRSRTALPITRVSVALAAGGMVQLSASNSHWTGFALERPEVVFEKWDEAAKAVAMRRARWEEASGRGDALKEVV